MKSLIWSLVLLVPIPAYAAPMLLGEIRFAGGHDNNYVLSNDAELPFSFLAGSMGLRQDLIGSYTLADVGRVIHATPEQVANFNLIFRDRNAYLLVQTIANYREFALFELWGPFSLFTAHVPLTDGSLSNYTITTVTQTIDGIRYEEPVYECHVLFCGPTWRAFGEQTIRIYGVPVPEPASWMLLLCGSVAALRWRR